MSANGVTNIYTIRHCQGCQYMLPVDSNDYDLIDLRWQASRKILEPD